MPDIPDLTGFTIMLIAFIACVVPQIRFYDRKKRFAFRFATILLALVVYLAVAIPELKTYPPTDEAIVYITDTGAKYHAEDCSHLWNSKIPITFKEAIKKGYSDCLNCDVPAYSTESIRITLSDLYPGESLRAVALATLLLLAYIGFHLLLYWISEQHKRKCK